MRKFVKIVWEAAVVVVGLVGAWSTGALADSPFVSAYGLSAQIYYSTSDDERIPELLLDHHDLEVSRQSDGTQWAHVSGTLAGDYYGLRAPDTSQTKLEHFTGADGKPRLRFEIDLLLSGRQTTAQLIVSDHRGRSLTEKWTIVFPGWDQIHLPAAGPLRSVPAISSTQVDLEDVTERPKSPVGLELRLGFGQEQYAQTSISSLQQQSVNVSGSLRASFSPRWQSDLGGSFTMLPLSSSISGINLQILGLKADFGYHFALPPGRWSLTVLGGAFYKTMFTGSSNAFGYSNLLGPEADAKLAFRLTGADAVEATLKAGAITQGGALSFSGSDFGAELVYIRSISGTLSGLVAIDYSSLSFSIAPVSISSTSMGVNVGMGW